MQKLSSHLLPAALMAAISLSAVAADWQKTPDGLVVNMPDKSTVIRLQPYADGSVRVTKICLR